MVHARSSQDELFGVSGYVYKNVFVIFDRKTQSLWWPMKDNRWTAISGPRKGEEIEFQSKPRPMTLGKWRKLHPKTRVLLGSRARLQH